MTSWSAYFLVVSIIVFFVCPLAAVPINSDTALTAAQGEIILREQIRYALLKDDENVSSQRTIKVLTLSNLLLYAYSAKCNITVIYPLLRKQLETDSDSDKKIRKDFGFGDLLVIGKYQIYTHDTIGSTRRAALFAGLEFPTGDFNKRDGFGVLPRPIQLGSGSWDPFVGGMFTWATTHYQLDLVGQYKINTKGHNFEFGDVFRHDTSLQYRVWPSDLPQKSMPSFIYLVLEANGRWGQKNKDHGVTDKNSGGYILLISPGIQYVQKRVIVEAAVQIPTIQKLHGIQPQHKFTFVCGIQAQF